MQRTAKEILKCLKQQHGEEQIEHIISESKDLLEEESNTLRRELKREEQVKEGKNSQGLKDFIKSMKSEGK